MVLLRLIQDLKCYIAKLLLIDEKKGRYLESLLLKKIEEYNLLKTLDYDTLTNDLIKSIWIPFFVVGNWELPTTAITTDDHQAYVSTNTEFLLLQEELEFYIDREDKNSIDIYELEAQFRNKLSKLNLIEQTIIMELLYKIRYEQLKVSGDMVTDDIHFKYMFALYQDVSYILSLDGREFNDIQNQIKFEMFNKTNPDLNKVLSLVRMVKKGPVKNHKTTVAFDTNYFIKRNSHFKIISINKRKKLQSKYGSIDNPKIDYISRHSESRIVSLFVNEDGNFISIEEEKIFSPIREKGVLFADDGNYSNPNTFVLTIMPVGFKFFYIIEDGKLKPAPTETRTLRYYVYADEMNYKRKTFMVSYTVYYRDDGEIAIYGSGDDNFNYNVSIDNGCLYTILKLGYGSGIFKEIEVKKEPIANGYRTRFIKYGNDEGKFDEITCSAMRFDKNIGDDLFGLGADGKRINVDQDFIFDKPDVIASLRKRVTPSEYKNRIERNTYYYYDNQTGEKLELSDRLLDKDGKNVSWEILSSLNNVYKIEYKNNTPHYYIDDDEVSEEVYWECRKKRTKPSALTLDIESVKIRKQVQPIKNPVSS